MIRRNIFANTLRLNKKLGREKNMIEFANLKAQFERYQCEFEVAVLRTLRSGWYIMGRELETFEKTFADYLGVRYCIGLNSGLDALTLAIRALGIGPGDEVIVPANTYIASVLGITENGATPVFVEPDEFFCLDADKIEAAITPKTKAVLPVHLYGQPCDMKAICAIAEKHGLFIVEDCAQSHGARLNGKLTGTFGTIGCFSFYPTKPLGALGDSGAVVTNDPILADRLRMLRNYGSGVKYVNEVEGVNSRLDEVQAAVLQVGLRHLEEGNAYRNRIAERYLAEIRNPRIVLPGTRAGADHVYHIFGSLCEKRNDLQRHMADCGVKTLIHYPIPPHLQRCYARFAYAEGSFPISEAYAGQELSLPIYVGMPEADADAVIEAVNSF